MKIYLKLSLILFFICAVSAGALALVDSVTKDRIAANEESKERMLRGKALAGEERSTQVVFDSQPVDIGGRRYYVGRIGDKVVGTAFTAVTNKGYGGPIEIVIGMDASGEKLAGIRIKSHSETPGLGANAAQIRYGEIEPWFLAQFAGLSPASIWLKLDNADGKIDAITAATITSRAVTDCVREEVVQFEEALGQLEEKVAYERAE